MFSKDYIDPAQYVSLTQAAELSGLTYEYVARLVHDGRIARAPIDEAIMVSVVSLEFFMLSRIEREALLVAREYGTVQGGGKNRRGPKYGMVHSLAAQKLVERGYLERLRDQLGAKMYCITDEGKKRVRNG